MEKIEVYTDGACSGNPGNGGYAFVILKGEKEILCAVFGYRLYGACDWTGYRTVGEFL